MTMILFLLAMATVAPKSISIVPIETIWVYENASTPADGSYLRAWGSEGKSCPGEGEDAGQFSYTYLKWDLADVPKIAKLVSAKLEFNNIPDPGFTVETAKKAPLEARAIVGEFDAKTWTFDMATKVHPLSAATAVYGSGYPREIRAGAPVSIIVDLMAGPNPFEKALRSALSSSSHSLSLAITSALDPSTEGRTCVYKVFGQTDSHENMRPKLTLTFAE